MKVWKLVQIGFVSIENDIPAITFTYDNSKLRTTKAIAYFLTRSKFRIIPEYDFLCMIVDLEGYEDEFKVYEATIKWLGVTFHKRFNFIKSI